MSEVTSYPEELLTFFKALADANRLKIIGVLARGEYSVEQLAAVLGLKPSTVSHHLSMLAHVGLVSARAESYYNIYRLEEKALEETARRVLSIETLSEAAQDVDLDAYDRIVVKNYVLPNGRLKGIPTQLKKFEAIMRFLAQSFEPGRAYSEKEVNVILVQFFHDVASLRRGLIETKLLERDSRGTIYRRAAS